MPQEKKHRLPEKVYSAHTIVSFTACVKDRKSLFTSYEIFNIFQNILLDELIHYECGAFVYLFMPDHLHLIMAGLTNDSQLKKCMDMFKQKTGYWLGRNNSSIRWQKDYYDHIIRDEEELFIRIKYILQNPVKKELAKNWKEYPYKGSTIYNFNDWSEDL